MLPFAQPVPLDRHLIILFCAFWDFYPLPLPALTCRPPPALPFYSCSTIHSVPHFAIHDWSQFPKLDWWWILEEEGLTTTHTYYNTLFTAAATNFTMVWCVFCT